MHVLIQKSKDAQRLCLPEAIFEAAQFNEDEPVQIAARPGAIVIKKASSYRHRSLKERLEGYTGEYEYVFEEWNTGASVGTEVL